MLHGDDTIPVYPQKTTSPIKLLLPVTHTTFYTLAMGSQNCKNHTAILFFFTMYSECGVGALRNSFQFNFYMICTYFILKEIKRTLLKK